jgi:hypothetical protein
VALRPCCHQAEENLRVSAPQCRRKPRTRQKAVCEFGADEEPFGVGLGRAICSGEGAAFLRLAALGERFKA